MAQRGKIFQSNLFSMQPNFLHVQGMFKTSENFLHSLKTSKIASVTQFSIYFESLSCAAWSIYRCVYRCNKWWIFVHRFIFTCMSFNIMSASNVCAKKKFRCAILKNDPIMLYPIYTQRYEAFSFARMSVKFIEITTISESQETRKKKILFFVSNKNWN